MTWDEARTQIECVIEGRGTDDEPFRQSAQQLLPFADALREAGIPLTTGCLELDQNDEHHSVILNGAHDMIEWSVGMPDDGIVSISISFTERMDPRWAAQVLFGFAASVEMSL